MVQYDSSKDEILKEIGIIKLGEKENSPYVQVNVMRYDLGEPKIQVSKAYVTKEGEKGISTKVPRLSYQQTSMIVDLFTEALLFLDNFVGMSKKK